jgi:amino acid adenylation domain-containing protein
MPFSNLQMHEYAKDLAIPQLFERQASRTPQAVAVSFGAQVLTYLQLNQRANQLARHLRARGVEKGSLVGVGVERSLDMVVALLGILKAACAYIPLDPAYPQHRLAGMMEDSKAELLLTQSPLVERFAGCRGTAVCLDREWPAICRQRDTDTSPAVSAAEPAYVMYTSGSAGWPKGVQIAHRGVVNALHSLAAKIGMTRNDVLISVSSMSFDIHVLDVWMPLARGARLVLADTNACRDGAVLENLIRASGGSVMQATPSTWQLLLDSGWQGSRNLTAVCGGEILPGELAQRLRDKVKTLWNAYGPTETTVWSSTHLVDAEDDIVPIGRPLANTQFYVMDDHKRPVPPGVPGELYIGGDGVALGYLHHPELTAERFLLNPFDRSGNSRLYRTRDRVRQRADGNFEFLGRLDHQVKLRGYRIELGEISAVLVKHPEVKEAVTTLCDRNATQKHLVAHVVITPGNSTRAENLTSFLKTTLPDYMLPARFVFLDALPRLPNGKVDYRALSEPAFSEIAPGDDFMAPRDAIEQGVAGIFEELLKKRPVSVRQSFLDLGGDSLLVARLHRRIEQTFGKRLPMARILEAPTIEQLASILRNHLGPPSLPGVIPIQTEGSFPPFLCLGAGPSFLPLARLVGDNVPFLGLDLGLLDPAELAPPYRLEDLAAQVARRIRELQPEGPYYVGGWCRFGSLAYETARQILAQGAEVPLLTLIDSPNPAYYRALPVVVKMQLGVQRLGYHLAKLRRSKASEAPQYVRDRLSVIRYKAGKIHVKARHALGFGAAKEPIASLESVLHVASAGYLPPPYPGRVVIFQAAERPRGPHWDLRFRWRDLIQGHLEVYDIPGGHEGMFHQPHVQVMAGRIRECLSLPEVRNCSGG